MFYQTERVKYLLNGEVQEATLQLWHASDARVWLGVFKADESGPAEVSDFANVTHITFEIYERNYPHGAILVQVEVPIAEVNTAMTAASWDAGTDYSVQFVLDAAQLNQPFQGSVGTFAYVVYATSDTGGRHVMLSGNLLLKRSLAGGGGTPPDPPDIYYTKTEVDALIASIGVAESPYTIVDTEVELSAALLTGKKIVMRGEGNGGIINITQGHNVLVRGTEFLGYGYKPGATGYFGALRAVYADPSYASGDPLFMFTIKASDFKCEGIELRGSPTIDMSKRSPVAFRLDPTVYIENVDIRNCWIYNVVAAVGKYGYEGCQYSHNVRIVDNQIEGFQDYAISFRQAFTNHLVKGNHFIGRMPGQAASVNRQAMTITADIYDGVVEGNVVQDCDRWGIEMTSVLMAGETTVFCPMKNNKILGNVFKNVGSGISIAYTRNGIVSSNIIEGATSVGIESANGHAFDESTVPSNNIITDNIIREIHAPSNYAAGISCDQTTGDIVRNNFISNITGTSPADSWNYGRGIHMYRTRRCNIDGNHFEEVDGSGVYLLSAGVPEAETQAIVQNNRFRVSTSSTNARYAVIVINCSAVVRNNVAYEPAATSVQQRFYVYGNVAASVYAGNATEAPIPAGLNFFKGTNLVIPY